MIQRLYPTEHQEQASLLRWAQLSPTIHPYLLHIPNEGKRTMFNGSRMKAAGLKAGVSDLFFAFPTNKYHGLWIEMKRREAAYRKPSESQQFWIDKMNKVGYLAVVAKGWDHARDIILDYLEENL